MPVFSIIIIFLKLIMNKYNASVCVEEEEEKEFICQVVSNNTIIQTIEIH